MTMARESIIGGYLHRLDSIYSCTNMEQSTKYRWNVNLSTSEGRSVEGKFFVKLHKTLQLFLQSKE